jgi:NAD-dependent SIR2 family protein deacetylase
MEPVTDTPANLDRLAELIGDGGAVILSGAGLSTESGIPDYRGETGSQHRGQPMTYQTFTRDPVARRRYWARSHLGWRMIGQAAPNAGHAAVTAMQHAALLAGIITQNVDGLHQASGARDVIELHGNLARVVCLCCGDSIDRGELDRRLREANPSFDAQIAAVNPDGDVEIGEEGLDAFYVIGCGVCVGGTLKPDVVFFGESVPRSRVDTSFALIEAARSVIVLGSSLTVMSGRRFVLHALKRGTPVAIVNRGETRLSDRADLVIDGRLGSVLPAIVERLSAVPAVSAVPEVSAVSEVSA